MNRFLSYRQTTGNQSGGAAAEFLRQHRRMAGLLPQASALLALKAECMKLLPSMFASCEVVRFEAGLLVIHLPNAAMLTKLKQQLPKLQEHLAQRGWQVTSIRLKVQVSAPAPTPAPASAPPRQLSQAALAALDELEHNLAQDRHSQDLHAAVKALLQSARHQSAE
ncbi:DciA family protein [Massilia sp. W12]|uniref:DciA family protein n=1 Tax=Massilia sp. W12 TaxID=3126507 RepID=UPI0030D34D33